MSPDAVCELLQLMIDGGLLEPRFAKIFLLKYGNPRSFPSVIITVLVLEAFSFTSKTRNGICAEN